MEQEEPPSASPFGVAHFRAILDEGGEVEDCLFLEMNLAFEELTGLRAEEVMGHRGGGILSGLSVDIARWKAFYAGVLRTGRTREMTRWVAGLNCYLTITATPLSGDCFLVILSPADQETYCTLHNEELARALEPLDYLFQNQYDAVSLLEYDEKGECRYVRNNPVHQRLTGFRDIGGKGLDEVVGPETGAVLRRHYEVCMRTGRPVNYEQEFHFAPGVRVWQTEVTPVFGSSGVYYLLCFSKDITELKQVQQENEVLNSRLRAMFNQHSVVKMIFEADSGRIVDVNPAACDLYGYTREEFLSMRLQDVNALPVDLAEENRRSREPGGLRNLAMPQRVKDGTLHWMDIYSCPISVGEKHYRYSIVVDVTEREIFRNALMREKELLETTLQSIGDGVVTTDNVGHVTNMNKVAEDLTGWERAEAVGHPFEEVFCLRNEETGAVVESPIRRVLETGLVVGLANHTELIHRRGERTPIADSAAPIRTKDGVSHGVVMVFRDVSAEKAHSEKIEFLSSHDPLTGLYNRRGLLKAMETFQSTEHLPIAVLMGDVNGLKLTNDFFGHQAGDALLENASRLLREYCEPNGLVARWGGDEFLAVLPRTELWEAERLANEMRSSRITIAGKELSMSISLGCGMKSELAQDLQEVLSQAEESMYHRKLLDGKSYRNALINALLDTLHQENGDSEERTHRIDRYCRALGVKLGLSAKEMEELSLLVLLHDIGKVGISAGALGQEETMSAAERSALKRHPEAGYRVVKAIPELSAVAELILAHHERWDGSGYPQGLQGERIPLLCRILDLAQSLEMMTTGYHGERMLSREDAMEEIAREAGTRFDPMLTQLFIETIKMGVTADDAI